MLLDEANDSVHTVRLQYWGTEDAKLSGAVRSSMEQYGAVWSSMEQYGTIWSSMKQYGAVWSSMEQYEEV